MVMKDSRFSAFGYAVEWSDTLEPPSWSSSGVGLPVFVGDINSNTQQWKVLVPVDSAVPRRFVHLRVKKF
jgi:hypothetical protein